VQAFDRCTWAAQIFAVPIPIKSRGRVKEKGRVASVDVQEQEYGAELSWCFWVSLGMSFWEGEWDSAEQGISPW